MTPSQRAKERVAMLKLRYSGYASRPVWDIVNGCVGKDRHYLYIMCCNLQDLEARTIRALNEAALSRKRGRKRG